MTKIYSEILWKYVKFVMASSYKIKIQVHVVDFEFSCKIYLKHQSASIISVAIMGMCK